MISCSIFRETFVPATGDAALLEHLRTCDSCLEFAIGVDPDSLFRALGGPGIVPAGGVDSFVADVMQQVRMRGTESTLLPATQGWTGRLAMAATIAASVAGGALFLSNHSSQTPAPLLASAASRVPAPAGKLTTKPIIDMYESDKATIVEIPTVGTNDVRVVMVIDENLPADL